MRQVLRGLHVLRLFYLRHEVSRTADAPAPSRSPHVPSLRVQEQHLLHHLLLCRPLSSTCSSHGLGSPLLSLPSLRHPPRRNLLTQNRLLSHHLRHHHHLSSSSKCHLSSVFRYPLRS